MEATQLYFPIVYKMGFFIIYKFQITQDQEF